MQDVSRRAPALLHSIKFDEAGDACTSLTGSVQLTVHIAKTAQATRFVTGQAPLVTTIDGLALWVFKVTRFTWTIFFRAIDSVSLFSTCQAVEIVAIEGATRTAVLAIRTHIEDFEIASSACTSPVDIYKAGVVAFTLTVIV